MRALFQHAEERVPRFRSRARSRPPHPAAQPPRARGPTDAGRVRCRGGEADDHLPRPVLPRPAQPGLLTAARAAAGAAGSVVRRDGAVGGALLLLRCRGCPHVDGGEPRRADQRQPHQGGRGHRRRPDRRRLPVLPGDAVRRLTSEQADGIRPRGGRGPRRRADAAGLGEGRVRDAHPRVRRGALRRAPRRPGPSRSRATTPRRPRRSPRPPTSARPPRPAPARYVRPRRDDEPEATPRRSSLSRPRNPPAGPCSTSRRTTSRAGANPPAGPASEDIDLGGVGRCSTSARRGGRRRRISRTVGRRTSFVDRSEPPRRRAPRPTRSRRAARVRPRRPGGQPPSGADVSASR